MTVFEVDQQMRLTEAVCERDDALRRAKRWEREYFRAEAKITRVEALVEQKKSGIPDVIETDEDDAVWDFVVELESALQEEA